jgi:phage host-nuclease inhibitor protein Gam
MVETYLHSAITIVVGVFGYMLKVMWDSVKDLQRDDERLLAKINDLQVAIATDYAKREELRGEFKSFRDTLNRIERKLDNKADK